MKRIKESTWSNIQVGMTTTVITAFIFGILLINSQNFLSLYLTKIVPISLTVGGLAYCVTKIFKYKNE